MLPRWIIKNAGLAALSVLLAIATWMISTWQEDPIIEDKLNVRIVKLGEGQVRDNAVLTGNLPESVTVRLRAPRSVFLALQATAPHIEIDLVRLGAGSHTISLTPQLNISPTLIVATTPDSAQIIIEPLQQMRVPVNINVVGVPAIGFKAGQVKIDPLQATIVAPREVISRVASVSAEVAVDNARTQLELNAVRVTARDSAGSPVAGVKVAPETISVRVPLEQLSNYRDLPIVVRWRGQPAEGYSVSDISVEPLIVTVFGAIDNVQATKGFIETLEVPISNAKGDIDERVGLNVPPGVSLVSESQTVRVRIRIRPLIASRTVKRKPVVIGLATNLSAVVSPATVDVVLDGPLPRLNALTEDDIRVTLDAKGLSEGSYQLTPNVIVPDDVTAKSVVPATIQIELKAIRR